MAIEQWSSYSVGPPQKLWRPTSKLAWSIRRTKSFSMSAPITLNIKSVARCWIDHRQIENSSDATSAISRLTSTRDEFNRAVKDANKHLKSYCRQNGWKLIQHLKITENGLNKGGLHLSYKGNQNILTTFTCSPQISCVLSVLNPTVNPIYQIKAVERVQHRFGLAGCRMRLKARRDVGYEIL